MVKKIASTLNTEREVGGGREGKKGRERGKGREGEGERE